MKLLIAFCFGAVARRVAEASPNPKSVLDELVKAVAAGDGKAVYHLTEQLRSLVPNTAVSSATTHASEGRRQGGGPLRRARQDHASVLAPPAAQAVPAQRGEVPHTVELPLLSGRKQAPERSIFDDDIFALSPVSKAELRQELLKPETAAALSWIKTGGYYHCAYEQEHCACHGQARYGSPNTGQWSAPVAVAGSIHCSVASFGDPAPGIIKQCGCHRGSFELVKRENSQSLLQEAVIFLLRLAARLRYVPFTGDRRYHGMELWSARHGGQIGGTLERFWIDKFLQDSQPHLPGPKCLEWGIHYMNKFPQCTEKYEVRYEPVYYGEKTAHVEGHVVYSSIYNFPSVIGSQLRFNTILATELFEHLEDPHSAASALFAVLAPGGALLFTAPQQAQYHQVPQDFLRYTKAEVKFMLENAGFCVPKYLMSASGDFVFDMARNMGLVVQDFTTEELQEGYQQGYDQIADGAITIQAVAYRPPHFHCGK